MTCSLKNRTSFPAFSFDTAARKIVLSPAMVPTTPSSSRESMASAQALAQPLMVFTTTMFSALAAESIISRIRFMYRSEDKGSAVCPVAYLYFPSGPRTLMSFSSLMSRETVAWVTLNPF